jgi:hypothetical protein
MMKAIRENNPDPFPEYTYNFFKDLILNLLNKSPSDRHDAEFLLSELKYVYGLHRD